MYLSAGDKQDALDLELKVISETPDGCWEWNRESRGVVHPINH